MHKMDNETREKIMEAIKSYKELPVSWNELSEFFKKVGYYPNGAPDSGRTEIGVGRLPTLWPDGKAFKEDILIAMKYLPVVVFDLCRAGFDFRQAKKEVEMKNFFDKELLKYLLKKEELYLLEDVHYYPGGADELLRIFSLKREEFSFTRNMRHKDRIGPLGYSGEILLTQKLKEAIRKK